MAHLVLGGIVLLHVLDARQTQQQRHGIGVAVAVGLALDESVVEVGIDRLAVIVLGVGHLVGQMPVQHLRLLQLAELGVQTLHHTLGLGHGLHLGLPPLGGEVIHRQVVALHLGGTGEDAQHLHIIIGGEVAHLVAQVLLQQGRIVGEAGQNLLQPLMVRHQTAVHQHVGLAVLHGVLHHSVHRLLLLSEGIVVQAAAVGVILRFQRRRFLYRQDGLLAVVKQCAHGIGQTGQGLRLGHRLVAPQQVHQTVLRQHHRHRQQHGDQHRQSSSLHGTSLPFSLFFPILPHFTPGGKGQPSAPRGMPSFSLCRMNEYLFLYTAVSPVHFSKSPPLNRPINRHFHQKRKIA